MTEVAFHFNVPATQPYACRLLRKAMNAGAQVIVVGDDAQLQGLDRALWTFSPLDFVAHCHADSSAHVVAASPIVLTPALAHPTLAHKLRQVLLNLTDAVPQGFDAFERLIEIVGYDESERQNARLRWKHYVAQGLTLVRHDLAAQGG